MALFNRYPYTDFNNLNLDWVIKELMAMREDMQDVVELQAITYADPLQWDITAQYRKNTVVVNSDGTAYLSVQPVPTGIVITNTDYWTPIGNFLELWNDLKASICSIDLGSSATATEPISKDALFFMQNDLYLALNDISTGSLIVDGGNAEKKTLEEYLSDYKTGVSGEIQSFESNINGQITDFTGSINNQFTDFTGSINDQFTDFTGNITEQINDIRSRALNERIKDHARYYIDGLNGSDNNDGLTENTAFKTIDRALELTDRYTEVRYFIISSGTYKVTKGNVCASCSIHFTALTSSVTLDFITTDDISSAFYLSHLKFEGVDVSNKLNIDCHGADNTRKYIYFDNCLLTADYVAFMCFIRLFGGASIISHSSIDSYRIDSGFFSFSDGTIVTNVDNSVTPFMLVNSYGRMIGTYTASELTAPGTSNSLVTINNTRALIGSVVLPALTNSYYYGLTLSNCSEIFITATRLTNIGNRAVNGNNIANNSVVWTDQGIQYPYATRYYNGTHQYWNGTAWTNI